MKSFDELYAAYNPLCEADMSSTGTKILTPSLITKGTVLISKLMPGDIIYLFNNNTFKTILDLTMAAAKTEEEQANIQIDKEDAEKTSKKKEEDANGLFPIAQETSENIDTIKVSAMILRLNRDIQMKNNNVLFEITEKAVTGKTNAYRLVAVNTSMIFKKSKKDDKLFQKMLTLLNKNAELIFRK